MNSEEAKINMPLKLIGTIILLVIVTIFCGFNLDDVNRCDISVVFYTFRNVPVFLTVLVSFLAGMLVMSPFALFKKKMTKEQIQQAADRNKAQEQKTAERAAKKADKAESKAMRQQEKASSADEKTVFDLKIRRPVFKGEKKSAPQKEVNAVPKAASTEKSEKKQDEGKSE